MLDIGAINNVQKIEYRSLVSTFWYIFDPEYNCNLCKKKFSESVRDKKKACLKERPSAFIEYDEILSYNKCPSNYYNSLYASFIDMFSLFQSGMLPFEGGLLDQPSKTMDIFKIIATLNSELAKKAKEKAEKWQKTQSRSSSPLRSKKR